MSVEDLDGSPRGWPEPDPAVERLSVNLGCARLERDNALADLSAAQQKIAELEAENLALHKVRRKQDELTNAQARRLATLTDDLEGTRQAARDFCEADAKHFAEFTAERQRRESAETALRLFADFRSCPEPVRSRSAFDQARDHFTRYPNASDSEERGG